VHFILKAHEIDPLICPKYQNEMKITSILEENAVTRAKKIAASRAFLLP
jgi:hypothetical protein